MLLAFVLRFPLPLPPNPLPMRVFDEDDGCFYLFWQHSALANCCRALSPVLVARGWFKPVEISCRLVGPSSPYFSTPPHTFLWSGGQTSRKRVEFGGPIYFFLDPTTQHNNGIVRAPAATPPCLVAFPFREAKQGIIKYTALNIPPEFLLPASFPVDDDCFQSCFSRE